VDPDLPVRIAGVAPEIRAGLEVGASAVAVGGGAELDVIGTGGEYLGVIREGETWQLVPGGSGILIRPPRGGRITDRRIVVAPRRSGEFVRVARRDYRGTLEIVPDRTGLTVINRVGLEEYLVGVVGAEMGNRPPGDREAVRAQAVISRTYALRNRNRWRAQGFDYYATVADQVYHGVTSENPMARDAVDATRGTVVTWGGAPIDAFFSSTCGGRTELGTEVFRGADRPYLKSIADVDGAGAAYCRESPRFRWREEWTGAELRQALGRGLTAIGAVTDAGTPRIRDMRIDGRTASGRVATLVVSLPGRDVRVESARVRQALRRTDGSILPSALFSLRPAAGSSEVTGLVAEGSGSGHGVGLCQWGAIGRSRAGQRYSAIIAAYFPGTRLERFY